MDDLTHKYDFTEVEHYHDFTEVVFIIKGHGIQVVESFEYEVTVGDVFVLQGNQRHYLIDACHVEIVNVMYDDRNFPDLISTEIKKLKGFKRSFKATPHKFGIRFRKSRQLGSKEVVIS